MSGSLELGGPRWGWTGKWETELQSRKTACELELRRYQGFSVADQGLKRGWGTRGAHLEVQVGARVQDLGDED